MIDKIYYGVLLFVCFGLSTWAIKALVTRALTTMTTELTKITNEVNGLKTNLDGKYNTLQEKIVAGTKETKKHFDSVCVERQAACSGGVNIRLGRLEGHGHVGLKGENSKVTM